MDEVKKLQDAIKLRLAETGMSQADLAKKIFVEENDEDDDLALQHFINALKKQLNRTSTPITKLRRYWEILLMDRRGLEDRYSSVASSHLSKDVLKQMNQISAEIDAHFKKNKL